jgi:hypothetical protein
MALVETPEGLVRIGGTKTFRQVQTENAEKRKAMREQNPEVEIAFSPCGVPMAQSEDILLTNLENDDVEGV